MNWRMKLKLLQKQGISREAAMEQLLDEAQNSIRTMDERLSACIDLLPKDQVIKVFGDLSNTDNS